ncbi:MAG: glycine cleavage system protein GcvH [Candidatus Latescibacteria bacterium]|jgi:glycine cleavage system H protein|nr:glycine cleavage system protein GcvH [Candidatus Latescibacterota bacterium]
MASEIPGGLLYTSEHEWVRVEGDLCTIGITDYAQGELGDIVFVELPEVGDRTVQGEAFGTVEAVKTVADLFAPVSGEVVEVNGSLAEDAVEINQDPYDAGWMIKVRMEDPAQADGLLAPEDYGKLLEEA